MTTADIEEEKGTVEASSLEGVSCAAPSGSGTAPYRLTVVIEYPNMAAAPGIGKQPCLGGTIMGLQFNDALKELEVLREALENLRCLTICSTAQDEIIHNALEFLNVVALPTASTDDRSHEQ